MGRGVSRHHISQCCCYQGMMTLDTSHIWSHMYLPASFLVVVHKDSIPIEHAMSQPLLACTAIKLTSFAPKSLHYTDSKLSMTPLFTLGCSGVTQTCFTPPYRIAPPELADASDAKIRPPAPSRRDADLRTTIMSCIHHG
jgi:hypothetical protein